jgi:hypothetical protein
VRVDWHWAEPFGRRHSVCPFNLLFRIVIRRTLSSSGGPVLPVAAPSLPPLFAWRECTRKSPAERGRRLGASRSTSGATGATRPASAIASERCSYATLQFPSAANLSPPPPPLESSAPVRIVRAILGLKIGPKSRPPPRLAWPFTIGRCSAPLRHNWRARALLECKIKLHNRRATTTSAGCSARVPRRAQHA